MPPARNEATLSFCHGFQIGPDHDRDLGVELHEFSNGNDIVLGALQATGDDGQ